MQDERSPAGRWEHRLRTLSTSRIAYAVALGLVLLGAAFVRWQHCKTGLPYVHRWGETTIVGRALDMIKTGDLNPHWFKYGGPTIYLESAVDALHFVWMRGQPEGAANSIGSLDDILTPKQMGSRWLLSHPSFLFWNRAALALCGLLTVLVATRLARLFVGRWWALLAGASLAVLPTHVFVSTAVRPDALATMFTVLAVAGAVRFLRHERASSFIASLVCAGLAAATKYNAAMALLAPWFALLLAMWRKSPGHRRWMPLAAFALPPLAFLAGNPFALVEPTVFLEHAGDEYHHYHQLGQPGQMAEPGLAHAWIQLQSLAQGIGAGSAWLGWPLLLLALLGGVRLLRRVEGWVLCFVPIAFFFFMTSTKVVFEHNFALLGPYVAIALACGARGVASKLRAVGAREHGLWVAAMALVALVPMALSALEARRVGRAQDTRTRVVDELNRLAEDRGWSRVAVASELGMHPIDLSRIRIPHESWKLERLHGEQAKFDALVVPAVIDLRRGLAKAAAGLGDENYLHPDRESIQEAYEDLERRMTAKRALLPRGAVLLEIEGEPTPLSAMSVNPAVRIVLPEAEKGGD